MNRNMKQEIGISFFREKFFTKDYRIYYLWECEPIPNPRATSHAIMGIC
jgi:hypothetical protein